MQKLNLSIEVIGADETKEIDGISFNSCAFVQISIDDLDLLAQSEFEGTALHFVELELSLRGSGNYLIFTCACGVADDAGWTAIHVEHSQDLVLWSFDRELNFSFAFSSDQYRGAIEQCRRIIDALAIDIALEPVNVIFPD